MRRMNIGFLVLLLIVGFAAVSAVLVIKGNVNLSFDTDFISNVVFTKASTLDGTSTINKNEQNIDFETKRLSTVGDTAVLDYEVTNNSRQYEANVTINCGLKDTFSTFNDYFEITNDLTSPFRLESGALKSGKLTVKLIKAITENETNVELMCTFSAEPASKDSTEYVFEYKFSSNYVDPNLNGADPVLDEDKLIPVSIANNGDVRIVNSDEAWYDYNNKEWANAVIMVDRPSRGYQENDIIEESDIESYFVWIPRYKYQIFDKGEYTSASGSLPAESIAKEIQIVFEGKNTVASNGNEVGDWLTHPAFTNYDTNGIWVGKFETGYMGATSTVDAQVNTNDATKVIIKPNVYSWRGITVSNIFKTALAYESNLISHMMRNTEWGAVAYLSHSKYGINDEVRLNNNSAYLTGYAANEKDAGASVVNNSAYNTEIGYLASTTGNITGVYDMSGGAWEYVAGYVADTPGSSGFTTEELTSDAYAKHLDVYSADSSFISYNNRILGDATGEMGPFYSNGMRINNWYSDYSYFVAASHPWFLRGGFYNDASYNGQFNFYCSRGILGNNTSFRITLAFLKFSVS